MDAEETYYKLRDFALTLGTVPDGADDLLSQAAEQMAEVN